MRIRRHPAVAAALALAVVACGGAPATQPPAGITPAASQAPVPSLPAESGPPASEAPGSDTARVTITDNAFDPTAVDVSVGGEVVWSHGGQNPHTVTFADGGPDSGDLASGGMFRTAFDEPGEFSYVCDIHSQMQGTVTVSD